MSSRNSDDFFRWEPGGRIYKPDGDLWWSRTHAQSPRAWEFSDGTLRIVFSTRDGEGRTRPGYVDVQMEDPTRVVQIGSEPMLDLGVPGAFDDSGVMPSCFVRDGDRVHMFYTGWNRSTTVPYRLAIGLATSHDGGHSFQKIGPGPVMDRSLLEPISCSQPYVIPWGGGYRMFYLSIFAWREVSGRMESYYNLRYVDSKNVRQWCPAGDIAIECDDSFTKAVAVPTVWREEGLFRMIYSFRGDSGFRDDPKSAYRLGYAVSRDGDSWERLDQELKLCNGGSDWDSVMQAYPDYFESSSGAFLFYTGNGFGREGIGFMKRIK